VGAGARQRPARRPAHDASVLRAGRRDHGETIDVDVAARLEVEWWRVHRYMRISDQWVADGCDPASPAVAQERAELVRSYAALLAAVHR
jgi:hypothetical protein